MGVTYILRCDRCGYTDYTERTRAPGESNLGTFRSVTKLEVEFLFTHCSWTNESGAREDYYLLCEDCQSDYEELLQKLGYEVNSSIRKFFNPAERDPEEHINGELFELEEEND